MGVAGDRVRTDDIQFGKLKLYQLSYARKRKLMDRVGIEPTTYGLQSRRSPN